MVITIKKGETKKEIDAALKQLKKNGRHPKRSDFYGKLKGGFGDGLNYQKTLRNEWD